MSHRIGLHSDDRPYPGEELCYCDEKTDRPTNKQSLRELLEPIIHLCACQCMGAELEDVERLEKATLQEIAQTTADSLLSLEIIQDVKLVDWQDISTPELVAKQSENYGWNQAIDQIKQAIKEWGS